MYILETIKFRHCFVIVRTYHLQSFADCITFSVPLGELLDRWELLISKLHRQKNNRKLNTFTVIISFDWVTLICIWRREDILICTYVNLQNICFFLPDIYKTTEYNITKMARSYFFPVFLTCTYSKSLFIWKPKLFGELKS